MSASVQRATATSLPLDAGIPRPGPQVPLNLPGPEGRGPYAAPAEKKGWLGRLIESQTERGINLLLKDEWFDPFMEWIAGIDEHVWRSRPPGAPVPRQQGAWSFAVLGDYGNDRTPQKDVARNIVAGRPDVVVTTGDNVYFDGLEYEWRERWDPPELFGNIRRTSAVLPTIGNHDIKGDGGAAYNARFPELQGARYYSADHKDVHFVQLNSEEPLEPGTPQYAWLRRDLERARRRGVKWMVVSLHHPLLSQYDLNWVSKRSRQLLPIFQEFGVDLVFGGHEHYYDRSKPLAANGMVYVTTGTGGAQLVPTVLPQGRWSAFRDVAFGHVDVEVQDDRLVGRFILRDGTVRDTFVVPAPAAGAENAAAGAAQLR